MHLKKHFIRNSLASLGAIVFEGLSYFVQWWPQNIRVLLARKLGILFKLFAWQMDLALDKNLKNLFPHLGPHRFILRFKIFANFGETLLDFFFPNDIQVEVPDREKLEKIRAAHKGLLVLTFHMGHWELGARTMKNWGWPVSAVYQPYRNKQFKRVIESRRAPGVHFIPVGGKAVNGVRQDLQKGHVVAMLGDQIFGEEGTTVSILGKKVRWPKGPIVLAARDKTPIVVAVIIRTARRTYRAYIEEPLIPANKSKSEVDRLVQAVADKFSKFLTQFPEQWYRFREFEYVD